jgi:hypothetical protein
MDFKGRSKTRRLGQYYDGFPDCEWKIDYHVLSLLSAKNGENRK